MEKKKNKAIITAALTRGYSYTNHVSPFADYAATAH